MAYEHHSIYTKNPVLKQMDQEINSNINKEI